MRRRVRKIPLVAASKLASVTIIALCQVAALALWFSASAVVPALVAEYRPVRLRPGRADQRRAGGLRRRLHRERRARPARSRRPAAALRRLRARSGAIANALLLVVDPTSAVVPVLRFVTGVAMAGVYPVGMKLAATWAKGDMGLMVGILVGALTLGSALPHLFNALGGVEWRIPVAVSSVDGARRRRADRIRGHSARIARRRRLSIRAPCSSRGATSRCGSPTWATSATCGSCTRCGRGSASSCWRASR